MAGCLTHGKVPLDVGERSLPPGQLLERGSAVRVDRLRARHLAERAVECRGRGLQLPKQPRRRGEAV